MNCAQPALCCFVINIFRSLLISKQNKDKGTRMWVGQVLLVLSILNVPIPIIIH